MRLDLRHWVKALRTGSLALICLMLLMVSLDAEAQVVRAFSIRYQANTNGDMIHTGNTIMSCNNPVGPIAPNACYNAMFGIGGNLNNNDYTMAYIDADADAFGPTFNSSSADIAMPPGSTVLFAGLYWGGVSNSAQRGQMLLKSPATGGYSFITASQLDGSNLVVANNYTAFADVTSIVQAGGNGTYWGANIQSTTGIDNRWGGWALVIVYGNNSKPLKNLTVFDGYANIQNAAGITFSIAGFLTPFSGPVVTQVGTVGFDGDRNLTGDTLQVRSGSNPFTVISNAVNPANNFYNSTVSDAGVNIDGNSGTAARNPPYTNTMGLDIDRFTLPAGVVGNGATQADILINTGGEQYLPAVITFSTDLYVPIITPNLVKTVTDLNGGQILPGDVLRWNISMTNTGFDSGVNLTLQDNIPAFTTYVPGSLQIISGANAGAKTDAIPDDQADFRTGPNRVIYRLGTGAGVGNPANDTVNGGILAYTQSTSIAFDTTVNPGTPAGTQIINSGTIRYSGQTLSGTSFSSTSTAASATVLGAPTISKTFTPPSINPGGTSVLTIVTSNPAVNPGALNGVGFTDIYPGGLTNSGTPNPTIICTAGSTPGVITGGAALGNGISVNPGSTIAPGGSCTVTVNVTAAAGGNYVNTTSNVTSTNGGNGGTATATLAVGKLSVSKSFAPTTINAGQTSVLTFTVVNPLGTAITGGSFTDTFPSGLVFTGAVPANPCGAGSSLVDDTGGALAAGDPGIRLINGAIAANSSCTFNVTVRGTTATTFGIFNNTSGGVTRSGDAVPGNPSNTAQLIIRGAPTIAKTITPAILNTGDSATLSITITNPNTTVTVTRAGVVFLDTYPGGMINSTPASVTLSCTSGSSASVTAGTGTAGGSTIGLSNMSLAPGGSCTVTSRVVVTATSTNSSGVPTFDNAPSPAAATAGVTVTALNEPTWTKTFAPNPIAAGGVSTMSILIVNPNAAVVNNVTFTDPYPTGMFNGVTGGATVTNVVGTCTGATLSAPPSGNSLSVSGLNMSANAQCRINVQVTVPAQGPYTNVTSPLTTANTPPQNARATGILNAYALPQVTKAFGASSIPVGGTTTLTLTVTNTSGNPGNVTTTVIDPLPPGMQIAAPATFTTTNCGGGTVDDGVGALNAGDTQVRILNAVVAVGAPCVVTISNITLTTSGNFVNNVNTVNLTNTASGVLTLTGTGGSATISAGKPGIAKAFNPTAIPLGGAATLTFTVTNPLATPLTGVAFTDALTQSPNRFMQLASGVVAGTCTGVVSNAAPGVTNFAVTAANVPANGSCTIAVSVTSFTVGIQPNQTSGVSHAGDAIPGTVSNIANLTVFPPPTGAKTFTPSQIASGGVSTLSLTITNINNFNVTNLNFTDAFPSGMTVATPLAFSNGCGGTLQDSGGGALAAGDVGIRVVNGTVATNSACVVAISVTAATSGAYVNTIPAGGVTSSAGSNQSPFSATLNVLTRPTVAKSFVPASIGPGGTSVLTITLTNTNALPITGAAFNDTYPPLAFTNTATPNGATTCASGSVTAAASGTSLALSGATIPANGACTVTVNVTAAAAGTYVNPAFNTTTTNAGTATSNPATLSVGRPSIAKVFSPNPIAPGGVTTLSFTITNSNAAPITGVGFVDTYPVAPAGMVNTTPLVASTTCAGGTLTAVAGGGSITLNNNGTIPANSSCTVTVQVTTATPGIRVNTSGAVQSSVGAGNTATDTLTTMAPPVPVKSFSNSTPTVNQPVTITVRLDNPNAFPITGVGFVDTYPSGLVNSITPAPTTDCVPGGNAVAAAGGPSLSLTNGTIPANSFCTVTAQVVPTTVGILTNTIATGGVSTTNAGSSTVATSAALNVSPGGVGITGFVYLDANVSGNLEPPETWTSGVPVFVNLINGGVVVQSQLVNPGTGFFNFASVPPGNYTLVISDTAVNTAAVQPSGFFFTQPTNGASNVTVNASTPPPQYFGLVGASLSRVTGRVFLDTGAGAGTANDGILTTGEAPPTPGIPNVPVSVTDCGLTTFATTLTDGGGNFLLRYPSSATTVCVIENMPANLISTGASLVATSGATVIAPGPCTAPPSGSLQYDRANDRICFTKAAGNIDTGALYFGDVPRNTFVADGLQQTTPGNATFFPHIFTAGTGGNVTFGATVVSTDPNWPGWSGVLYRDTNCDAQISGSEAAITPSTIIGVTAGQQVCLVFKQFTPPNAPFNASNTVRIDSNFVYTNAGPALSATASRLDKTIVDQGSDLKLVKEVCNATQTACNATTGAGFGPSNTGRVNDQLVYRITYTNISSGPLSGVVVRDTAPPFTGHVASACVTTPAPLACAATTVPAVPVVGQTASYAWTMTGTMAPGTSGVVTFTVSIAP